MYQYKSAIGRLKGYNCRWLPVSVGNLALNTLVNNYVNIWFTLHDTIRNIDVNVQLTDLTSDYSDVSKTVTAWLTALGNKSLPEATLPSFINRRAYYKHAERASFKVDLTNLLRLNDTNIAAIDKPDLALTRSDTIYNDVFKYCLATVNGYIHQTDAGAHGFYIKDGAISGRIANATDVGLISFKEIGALTIIPITPSMLYTPNPGDKLYNGAYVKLPTALGNRIPMVVIGGYLHVLDAMYKVVSDHVIRINMLQSSLMQRYLESREWIDLSELQLTKSQVAPGSLIQSELYSDANIIKYLTLSQSFIVLVDTPHLYTESSFLGSSDLPGRCEHHEYLTQPVLGNLGRLVDYWCKKEPHRYMVCYKPQHRKRFHLETTSYESLVLFDDGLDTIQPYDKERLVVLEIGRDL